MRLISRSSFEDMVDGVMDGIPAELMVLAILDMEVLDVLHEIIFISQKIKKYIYRNIFFWVFLLIKI